MRPDGRRVHDSPGRIPSQVLLIPRSKQVVSRVGGSCRRIARVSWSAIRRRHATNPQLGRRAAEITKAAKKTRHAMNIVVMQLAPHPASLSALAADPGTVRKSEVATTPSVLAAIGAPEPTPIGLDWLMLAPCIATKPRIRAHAATMRGSASRSRGNGRFAVNRPALDSTADPPEARQHNLTDTRPRQNSFK